MKFFNSKKLTILMIAIMGIGIAAYYSQEQKVHANAPGEQVPQAMPVIVETVKTVPVQIWNDYSARLEAVDFAEIRPQASGKIIAVKFEDGQAVEKGDVLYIIDPRPFEASVNQLKAELNAAKNQASLSLKELRRAQELIKTDAISKRVLDERSSAHSVAAASVKATQARLERAQIDLDYAHVKAPITGRVSRAEIKEGNLVEAGPSAPLLTSIVSMDGIYADFEVDEQSYLKYIRSNARDLAAENKVPVRLTLSGESIDYEGFIHSFDNRIDVSSGTIRARALFANKDGALLPGMFATVKMGTPSAEDKILISERAIGTDQDRKFVYIVNSDNNVEYRSVKIGESVSGNRVIRNGLSAGDQVITEGIIRIRPGMPVQPKEKQALLENVTPPATEKTE